MTEFNWKLAQDSFTLWDRLCLAKWLLTTDQFTMGAKVKEFEAEMSKLAGAHAVGVANGSAANQLVFELWKVKNPGELANALVIVPAVTWISSISPAVMAGFEIQFCDVNVTDFSFDYDALQGLLESNKGRRIIIWPTALIGFTPDMTRLKALAKRYRAELFLDSCENTLSYLDWNESILASAPITTTSCYFSHQITAVEFGFAFFQDEQDAQLARVLRNHGLTRSLPSDSWMRRQWEADSSRIDAQFLFALMGTNLRPTDVHAAFGLRDIKRVDKYRVQRSELYQRFHEGLDQDSYYLPPLTESHVGFCLPIFLRNPNSNITCLKEVLNSVGIQTRPIIGGNLLHQPPFQKYGRPEDFPNAEWIHEAGAYVGLHPGVTEEMVDGLVELLNDYV